VDTVTFVTLNLNHTQWVRKTMLRDCRSRVAACEQGSRELFPVTRITNCRALPVSRGARARWPFIDDITIP